MDESKEDKEYRLVFDTIAKLGEDNDILPVEMLCYLIGIVEHLKEALNLDAEVERVESQ